MTTWVKTRFRKEDTLGKMVLSAELMGAVGFALVVLAFVLNRVL